MTVTAVLLVNSHETFCASELLALHPEAAHAWPHLVAAFPGAPVHHLRTPKGLLPGRLDAWWHGLRACDVQRLLLVTNGSNYKHYERWATSVELPVDCIVNDGTTHSDAALGLPETVALLTRRAALDETAAFLLAAETPLSPSADLRAVLGRLATHPAKSFGADMVLLGHVDTGLSSSSCDSPVARPAALSIGNDGLIGMVAADPANSSAVPHIIAQVPALLLLPSAARAIAEAADVAADAAPVAAPADNQADHSLMAFAAWCTVRCKIAGIALDALERLTADEPLVSTTVPEDSGGATVPIVRRAHARVGVMGNPSDGFFGKTISLSVRNFWAEVRLWPSARLAILPHPLYDPCSFGGLADLHAVTSKERYDGGVRLLLATCKRFYEYAREKGVELRSQNCTLAYDTNVPRQVGLAGSSAIITATTRCLMAFHGVSDKALPPSELATLVLSIEKAELGINAGLQDRVIQAYGGLVYMDFERTHVEATGRGQCACGDANAALIPPLPAACTRRRATSSALASATAPTRSWPSWTALSASTHRSPSAERPVDPCHTAPLTWSLLDTPPVLRHCTGTRACLSSSRRRYGWPTSPTHRTLARSTPTCARGSMLVTWTQCRAWPSLQASQSAPGTRSVRRT